MEPKIIKTLCGMEVKILPKQENIPAFDPTAIKIKHIDDEDPPYSSYEEDEITEEIISKILKDIPQGVEMYLYLDPFGEGDVFEVICDREWLAIGLSLNGGTTDEKNYYCYNPAFADTADEINKGAFEDKSIWTDLESGGQSPIPKIHAITDIELGVKAVEYFIRTGELYPGIDWEEQLD